MDRDKEKSRQNDNTKYNCWVRATAKITDAKQSGST